MEGSLPDEEAMSERVVLTPDMFRIEKGEYFTPIDCMCERCGAKPLQKCVVTKGERVKKANNAHGAPRESLLVSYHHHARFEVWRTLVHYLEYRGYFTRDSLWSKLVVVKTFRKALP